MSAQTNTIIPLGPAGPVSAADWTLERLKKLGIVTVCMLVGCATSVRAQDWIQTKDKLAKHGATLTVVYGGAVFSDLDGGVRRGQTYSGNLNLELSIDGERLLGRPGLTLFVDGLWVHGGQ